MQVNLPAIENKLRASSALHYLSFSLFIWGHHTGYRDGVHLDWDTDFNLYLSLYQNADTYSSVHFAFTVATQQQE